jgi:transcriptional regulator with XRE-family HTH domain
MGMMMNKIWKKMLRSKEYRDAYVAAHLSNTVAAQIFLLREREDWTQKQLADATGMRQSRISALEDPNYENFEVGTLRRLASAFDVALSIRFVPFSDVLVWAEYPSSDNLAPVPFKDDRCPTALHSIGTSETTIGPIGPLATIGWESTLPMAQSLFADRPTWTSPNLGSQQLSIADNQ